MIYITSRLYNFRPLSEQMAACTFTGGPDVEYDYNNILAVCKIMYENASKTTLNAMCRK